MKNQNLHITQTDVLSDAHYVLRRITFDYKNNRGEWQKQTREVYDRGNGATILLYNREAKTIILTRQFRMPAYLNGNETGMLIEACAGELDEDNPEDCIRRETEEETGYKISAVKKIFECYMSPGAVTEILHFFIGAYEKNMKVSKGGGVEGEQENIEVLEMPFAQALEMIRSGEIKDAKTVMLLQYAEIQKLL